MVRRSTPLSRSTTAGRFYSSSGGSSGDTYLDLILHIHPLRPIKNDQEYQEALKALVRLASDQRKAAIEFKKVLSSIIGTYEHEKGLRLDTPRVTPAQIVRHLLAERKMSVNAFAKARGISQSALSDMLNGKRDWSKSVIISVADYFGLNRGLFLR